MPAPTTEPGCLLAARIVTTGPIHSPWNLSCQAVSHTGPPVPCHVHPRHLHSRCPPCCVRWTPLLSILAVRSQVISAAGADPIRCTRLPSTYFCKPASQELRGEPALGPPGRALAARPPFANALPPTARMRPCPDLPRSFPRRDDRRRSIWTNLAILRDTPAPGPADLFGGETGPTASRRSTFVGLTKFTESYVAFTTTVSSQRVTQLLR